MVHSLSLNKLNTSSIYRQFHNRDSRPSYLRNTPVTGYNDNHTIYKKLTKKIIYFQYFQN